MPASLLSSQAVCGKECVGVGLGGFYGRPKWPTDVLVASLLLEVALDSAGPSSKDPLVFLSHRHIKEKSQSVHINTCLIDQLPIITESRTQARIY